MKTNQERIKTNIVYAELSFEIMNVLFKVQNMLGSKFQEKYYQRAIEIELKNRNIPFKREQLIRLEYEENSIGRYFIDFVIDGKIALEVKATDYFKKDFTTQVLAYLNSANLKLGIIANFNSNKLLFRRLINPEYDKKH